MLGIFITILDALADLLPIASVVFLIATRTTKVHRWLECAAFAAVGCYVLMIAQVQVTEVHLDRILAGYDLNGDNVFSGVEITPEMELAMKNVTSDTGRSFAPLTGLFLWPLYSVFWHAFIGIPFLLFSNLQQMKREKKTLAANGDTTFL